MTKQTPITDTTPDTPGEILSTLERLTDNLPELDALESVFGPIVVHHVDDNEPSPQISFGYSAYRDLDISLMRFFIAAGYVIPQHVSKQGHQWVGVIRGELDVQMPESNRCIGACGVTHIPPDTPVSLKAETDVWFWVMSQPPSPGSPPSARTTPFPFSEP